MGAPSFSIHPGLHVYLWAEVTMKRTSFLFLVTILLTGCAATSFTPTPTLPPTAETLSSLPEPTDHTQLIPVKAGETFDLVVPSNPSTGYRWDILPELDVNILEFVAQEYIPEEPILIGSGGVDVWTFRALNAGETTIVLGYYPPGSDTDPEETVTFSIRVE
jgi:inhibitor of cysteine peptidase